jgi:glycosyltransferase involved in cell wall biosynthesis
VKENLPTASKPDNVNLYVDIGDVLFFLMHHSSVSGIQRVVIETWRVISQENRFNVHPVAFCRDTNQFVLLDGSQFNELLDLLVDCEDEKRITSFAKYLYLSLSERVALNDRLANSSAHSGTLLIAGSAWTSSEYFHGVNQLKRNNLKVITLVYDLIPIIFESFPQQTRLPFIRYLLQATLTSDSVATISNHTRKDFDNFCLANDLVAPSGPVTRLPGGFIGQQVVEPADFKPPSSRYVLMVGTIEERKNHLLALRAYRKVVDVIGHENAPDIVCVGRLGWNISEFIEEWHKDTALQKKFILLTNNENDNNLSHLYRNALFTIYPSKYEGWGLPVSESLDFGVPTITSWASSLPEAGEEYATYVDPEDYNDLADKIILWLRNPELLEHERRRLQEREKISWNSISLHILEEVEKISALPCCSFVPELQFGIEYGLGLIKAVENIQDGREYLNSLRMLRSLPMTAQITTMRNASIGEFSIWGNDSTRTANGITFSSIENEVHIDVSFVRESASRARFLMSTDVAQRKVYAVINTMSGRQEAIFHPGSILEIKLSECAQGQQEKLSLRLKLLDEHSPDRFTITIKSILLLNEDDQEFESKLAKSYLNAFLDAGSIPESSSLLEENQILEDRIFALENSASWRLTRPVRAVGRNLRNVYRLSKR